MRRHAVRWAYTVGRPEVRTGAYGGLRRKPRIALTRAQRAGALEDGGRWTEGGLLLVAYHRQVEGASRAAIARGFGVSTTKVGHALTALDVLDAGDVGGVVRDAEIRRLRAGGVSAGEVAARYDLTRQRVARPGRGGFPHVHLPRGCRADVRGPRQEGSGLCRLGLPSASPSDRVHGDVAEIEAVIEAVARGRRPDERLSPDEVSDRVGAGMRLAARRLEDADEADSSPIDPRTGRLLDFDPPHGPLFVRRVDGEGRR